MRALFKALRFHQFAAVAQCAEALVQFVANFAEDFADGFRRRHIVALRIHRDPLQFCVHLAAQRVKLRQTFYFIAEQFNAHRETLGLGRVNINDIAAHAESRAAQFQVVARVLHLGQPLQNFALLHAPALL